MTELPQNYVVVNAPLDNEPYPIFRIYGDQVWEMGTADVRRMNPNFAFQLRRRVQWLAGRTL